MQKHNYFIDVLRFFASAIVVFFHLNQANPVIENWYRNIVKYGWLGVPIFFVVSGYCIILSAEKSAGPINFGIKRFFRIFPPYWLSIAIVFVAACFQKIYVGSNAVHNIPFSFSSIAATITLTTTPFSKIGTMNWVYWTLTCELFFYLTVFLALFLNKKYLDYCLMLISIFAAVLSFNTGPLFFFDQWPAFGLGLAVYAFFKGRTVSSRITFSALLIVNFAGLYHKFGFSPYSICTLITVATIFASHYIKQSPNIFATLGKHSYSVYLIHVPIGVYILGMLQSNTIKQNPWYNFLYDSIVFVLISIMAWVLYDNIEQRSIALGRKLNEKYTKNGRHPLAVESAVVDKTS